MAESLKTGDLRPQGRAVQWGMASCALALSLAGCGGGETTPVSKSDSAGQTSQSVAESNQKQPSTQSGGNGTASPAVDPEKKETKWIGDIPYDVFYDQPLSIAADTTRLGQTVPTSLTPEGSPTPGGAQPAMTPDSSASTEPTQSSGSEIPWADVLPVSVLVEIVKELRTQLTANLQTVATYNRNGGAIALDGQLLSAMAAIAEVHPEAVSWKENAKFVRDLGYEIYSNAGPSGREAWTSTKEPFEQAMTILNGGNPPDREADDKIPFSDAVYVSEMMKKIEASFNSLKANINTDSRMKEDPTAVDRELRLLAALGSMMADKSYDSAEEQKYQGFVKTFVDGGLQGAEAVKAGDFEQFQAALNQIQTTCAECHQQYRGADSGF